MKRQLPAIDGVRLRVGDVIEVRSPEEILATLDENGELGCLPFMPEMLRFCNRRMTVHKVATKLCNTISGDGMRWIDDAVHLTDARCDGAAHGGCQASCSLYWKTAWLRRVDTDWASDAPMEAAGKASAEFEALMAQASRRSPDTDGAERYRCQATELERAAPVRLPARDLGQYVHDVQTGNVTGRASFRALAIVFYNRIQGKTASWPKRLRVRGGRRFGDLAGTPGPKPTGRTDLQPGELVRIKSREEIAETVNDERKNRGLGIDAEMVRHCGKTAAVARRINQIIDEQSGRMLKMREPCIVLQGIVCEGANTMNCPREITPYWREIWLERVGAPAGAPQTEEQAADAE